MAEIQIHSPYVVRLFWPKETLVKRDANAKLISFREALMSEGYMEAAFGQNAFDPENDATVQAILHKHYTATAPNGMIIQTQEKTQDIEIKAARHRNGGASGRVGVLNFSCYTDIDHALVLGGKYIRSSEAFMQNEDSRKEHLFEDDDIRQYLKDEWRTNLGIVTPQRVIIPLYTENKDQSGTIEYSEGSFTVTRYKDWRNTRSNIG